MATILVIDDEPAIVDILRSILEEEGYKVITAANGRQGLELIAGLRPDAVICDVMMPVLDGRALCRALERDPSYHGVPVVLMSAVQNIVSRTDCKYVAYIQKPFDLDSILSTVARVVEAGPEREETVS